MINPEDFDKPVTLTITVWLQDLDDMESLKRMDYIDHKNGTVWLESVEMNDEDREEIIPPIGLFEIDSIGTQ